jgi:hypothetical protein
MWKRENGGVKKDVEARERGLYSRRPAKPRLPRAVHVEINYVHGVDVVGKHWESRCGLKAPRQGGKG